MKPANKRARRLAEDMVSNCNRLLEKPPDLKENLALQNAIKTNIEKFLSIPNFDSKLSENFEILWQSHSVDALFLLLVSDSPSNRECANDCIRMFTLPPKSPSKLNVNEWCGLILIRLCSLLLKHVPQTELQITQSQVGSAFNTCNVTLVNLIEKFGQIHSIPQFNFLSPLSAKQVLLPFISESTFRISSALASIYDAMDTRNEKILNSLNGYDCKCFSSFLSAYCSAVTSQKLKDGQCDHVVPSFLCSAVSPGSKRSFDSQSDCDSSLCDDPLSIDASLSSLALNFMLELESFINKLLSKVKSLQPGTTETCDGAMRHVPVSIHTNLPILISGLDSLSRTHPTFLPPFSQFLHRQKSNLNCFLQHDNMAKKNELWNILKMNNLLEIHSKEKWLYWNLPQPNSSNCEKLKLIISREDGDVLNQAFEQLNENDIHALRGGVQVQFLGEEGTGNGVSREFFHLLVKEIFNPQSALFQPSSSDYRCFTPYHDSSVNENHLDYFRFCGKMIALIMGYKIQTGLKFSIPFFNLLAKKEIKLVHMGEMDPEFYKNCTQILELPADQVRDLSLYFSTTIDHFGEKQSIDLIHDGENFEVNENNKDEFIRLMIQTKINAISQQASAFSLGFEEMLMDGMTLSEFLDPLNASDFNHFLCGKVERIDIEDWKSHTELHGYHWDDIQIINFWKLLSEMSDEDVQKLFFFVTAANHLPYDGFRGLPSQFHIHRHDVELSFLPSSRTCFFQLFLPPYDTFELMKAKFKLVIEASSGESFGFE